jgi:putative DNA primase/helicase
MSGRIEEVIDAAVEQQAEVERLASLDPILADREIKAAAKRLGCRVGTLDREVRQARSSTAAAAGANGSGTPLEILDPVPWPEPVDGAAVLDELQRELSALVVMPPEASRATALWIMFTYTIDAGSFAPRLLIKSPEKRCGKTTLLDALTEVCRRALPASNITAPALFRTVEKVHRPGRGGHLRPRQRGTARLGEQRPPAILGVRHPDG